MGIENFFDETGEGHIDGVDKGLTDSQVTEDAVKTDLESEHSSANVGGVEEGSKGTQTTKINWAELYRMRYGRN